jgi:hypothetical protein
MLWYLSHMQQWPCAAAAAAAAAAARDYTAKAYLQLLEALRAKADWLAQQSPGEHCCAP